jgi:hypothetical protein
MIFEERHGRFDLRFTIADLRLPIGMRVLCTQGMDDHPLTGSG